eukprot:g4043.t1
MIAQDTTYQNAPARKDSFRDSPAAHGHSGRLLQQFVITPGSPVLWWWRTLSSLVTLFYVVYVPFHLSFVLEESTTVAPNNATHSRAPIQDVPDDSLGTLATDIEPALNTVLGVDIVLRFLTAVRWRGLLVRNRAYIARTYLVSWFAVDAVAALPFGYTYNRMFLLLRFVGRAVGTGSGTRRRAYRINPGLSALLELMFALAITWHLIACSFWKIAVSETEQCFYLQEQQQDCWTPQLHLLLPGTAHGDHWEVSWKDRFGHSFFFAVSVTTGIGVDIIPHTPAQVAFTCVMVLLGLALFALLVGSAANAIQAFMAEHHAGRDRIRALDSYLYKHHVSFELQERVRSYLRYSADAHAEVESNDTLQSLPSVLKVELAFEVKAQYLEVVPVFADLPRPTMHALMHVVYRRVFLPNEVIITEGEVGDTLFVVQKGSVALEKDGVHLRVLVDGSYFGEQSFLQGVARSATAIAISFCETLYMTRDAVNTIAAEHAELHAAMQHTDGGAKAQMEAHQTHLA